MSLPNPERVFKPPQSADISVSHFETAYHPTSIEDAADYLATVALPPQVACYSGEARRRVARDIAEELFIIAADFGLAVQDWSQTQDETERLNRASLLAVSEYVA